MDIDDILAEVDGHTTPQETRDLQEMTRAWVTERSAPEILPWPAALMDRMLERIRTQIELIEAQTCTADPKSAFKLIILQTELERFKYLLRSYLRARLAKIDAYTLHHLTDIPTRAKLSESEVQYATAHENLLEGHYRRSFLGQFPEALRRLDDRQGGVDMVEGPDLDTAVFVRGLGGLVGGEAVEVVVEGTDIGFRMGRGDVWVVRWGAVRGAVERGEAELI